MPRPRKPDALSGAERQRRLVKSHRLVTLRVRPEVQIALQAERVRSNRSVHEVLTAALAALAREVEGLPLGKPTRSPKAQHVVKHLKSPDLFDLA